MGLEIERRFKLSGMPMGLDILRMKMIEQQYLVNGIEKVRIRKSTDTQVSSYELTVKNGIGMAKEENNLVINSTTYQELAKLSKFKPLEKIRYEVEYYGNIIEIDRFFHDADLVIAEVEFKTEQQANDFIPPEWFGQEITRKSQYSSNNIWKSLNGVEEQG